MFIKCYTFIYVRTWLQPYNSPLPLLWENITCFYFLLSAEYQKRSGSYFLWGFLLLKCRFISETLQHTWRKINATLNHVFILKSDKPHSDQKIKKIKSPKVPSIIQQKAFVLFGLLILPNLLMDSQTPENVGEMNRTGAEAKDETELLWKLNNLLLIQLKTNLKPKRDRKISLIKTGG